MARHRLKQILTVILLSAVSAGVLAQHAPPGRSGWYLGTALGPSRAADLDQTGWNLDPICYPDSACFDATPIPSVPGYTWQNEISLESSAAFELSLGRRFGSTRIELTVARQTHKARQRSIGIEYLDGTAILAREGNPVQSNSRASLGERRQRTVTLDAFHEFPRAWGAVTPYLGGGLGRAAMDIVDLRFSSDYRNSAADTTDYDPPLAFYNSQQDTTVTDETMIWRLHAGADYAFGPSSSIGLRLTHARFGDIRTRGTYRSHPVFSLDPDFTNNNVYRNGQNWSLSVIFRRSFGD